MLLIVPPRSKDLFFLATRACGPFLWCPGLLRGVLGGCAQQSTPSGRVRRLADGSLLHTVPFGHESHRSHFLLQDLRGSDTCQRVSVCAVSEPGSLDDDSWCGHSWRARVRGPRSRLHRQNAEEAAEKGHPVPFAGKVRPKVDDAHGFHVCWLQAGVRVVGIRGDDSKMRLCPLVRISPNLRRVSPGGGGFDGAVCGAVGSFAAPPLPGRVAQFSRESWSARVFGAASSDVDEQHDWERDPLATNLPWARSTTIVILIVF